jgi:hypothetical protein
MIENQALPPTEMATTKTEPEAKKPDAEAKKPRRTAVSESNETLVVNYKRSLYDPSPLSIKLLTKPLLEGGNLVLEQEWDALIQTQLGQNGMAKGSFRRVGTQKEFLAQPVFEQIDLVEKSHSGEFIAWAIENGDPQVAAAGRERFKFAGLDYEKAKVA